MRRHSNLAAHALLIAALSGCGPAEKGIEIDFSSRALLEQASEVLLYFYGPEVSCQLIRQTTPRPPAILGPYRTEVTEEKRQGLRLRVDEIPVGAYVVFVDALDADGGNVGSGCAPDQQILEKEVAAIRVTVSEGS